jgi:hypothetical protein
MIAARRRWGIELLFLATAAVAPPAHGGELCAAARTERIDALTTIGLEPVDFPPNLAEVPLAAATLWNEAPCAAAERPRFVAGRGERTLVVRWVGGVSSSAGVCGTFSGREIRLYAFARDPLDGGGLIRCGESARLAEILAHELGHALGLFDQRAPECGGRIMAQLVRRADGSLAARRVHAEECVAAASRFLTLAERRDQARGDEPRIASALETPWSAADLPWP